MEYVAPKRGHPPAQVMQEPEQAAASRDEKEGKYGGEQEDDDEVEESDEPDQQAPLEGFGCCGETWSRGVVGVAVGEVGGSGERDRCALLQVLGEQVGRTVGRLFGVGAVEIAKRAGVNDGAGRDEAVHSPRDTPEPDALGPVVVAMREELQNPPPALERFVDLVAAVRSGAVESARRKALFSAQPENEIEAIGIDEEARGSGFFE